MILTVIASHHHVDSVRIVVKIARDNPQSSQVMVNKRSNMKLLSSARPLSFDL